MSLLALQTEFHREIIADDDGMAPSSTGMAIYRDAYRGRLLAALETSFERTRRWTGEDTFTAAACHYILTHPPVSWTLDAYGANFPDLLAALFADDPEVAELAWLEWQMSQAFAAKEAPQFDPAALAAAGYSETDWEWMRVQMAAGFATRTVATNCTDLWEALADEAGEGFVVERGQHAAILVWRTELSPHYRIVLADEHRALLRLANGEALGAIASDADPIVLGEWMKQWFLEGVFSHASCVVQR